MSEPCHIRDLVVELSAGGGAPGEIAVLSRTLKEQLDPVLAPIARKYPDVVIRELDVTLGISSPLSLANAAATILEQKLDDAIADAVKNHHRQQRIQAFNTRFTNGRHVQQEIGLQIQQNRERDQEREDRGVTADTNTVEVPCAGLVLISPYLPHLFDTLKLAVGPAAPAENNGLALGLLHYLATGDTDPGAAAPTIGAILLGLDPTASMKSAAIENAHRAECDTLLDTVLNHWSGLGNTPAQGLRDGFLKRRGTWCPIADGGRIILETQPIDVLLATVPWSLSIIMHAWMPEPVHVEWPHG